VTALDELKRDVFFRVMEMTGRVFVVVRNSESVVVGTRGFLGEEKDRGLVLVFNSRMRFQWDEAGIHASLVFGTEPQKCFIPPEDIVSIYSPDASIQLTVSPGEAAPAGAGAHPEETGDEPEVDRDGNVIRVDFRKRKQD
jgi:hypothetical protein